MTTQKEIDKIFIDTLESVVQICEKTTSGNVSHNIATIKCKCRDMLQFYKENPVNPWHSVADGDFPLKAKNNNNSRIEFSVEVLVRLDKNRLASGRYYYAYKSWYVGLQRVYPTHWMEMPELPK